MEEKIKTAAEETKIPTPGSVIGCGICNCDSMMYCGPSGSYTEMYTMEKENKKDGDA